MSRYGTVKAHGALPIIHVELVSNVVLSRPGALSLWYVSAKPDTASDNLRWYRALLCRRAALYWPNAEHAQRQHQHLHCNPMQLFSILFRHKLPDSQ